MNILFVSSSHTPFNPHQGAEQRSNLLLKACLECGDVDIISFCHDYIDDSYGANVIFSQKMENNAFSLKDKREKFLKMIMSFMPSYMTFIDRKKERIIDYFVENKSYDVIVTRYAFSAINCGLYKYAEKLFVDVDDNPAKSVAALGASSISIMGKLFYQVYQKNILRATKIFNRKVYLTTYSNIDDARRFNSVFLPNVPYYDVEGLLPTTDIIKGRLLFVGDMTYPPNIEAMNHFVSEILPVLQNKMAEISLHIVGHCNDSNRQKWSEVKGVEVMGFVDSLAREYSQANVFILPIPEGAGTCIKFLEAAQMGRPIVTSEKGFQGYGHIFQSGRDCLVAHDDGEFVEFVIKLLKDDVTASQMVESANKTVKSNFSKDFFFHVVGQALGCGSTGDGRQ